MFDKNHNTEQILKYDLLVETIDRCRPDLDKVNDIVHGICSLTKLLKNQVQN